MSVGLSADMDLQATPKAASGTTARAGATLSWVIGSRPDTPVLRCRGVRKAYGSGRAARVVLDGVDLDVAAGELVAVTGRSGSGKSTLLQIAGGLDRPDGGRVEVAGRPLSGASERELSALRRDAIGFVFQFFHLLPELDGEANVMLAARLPGARRGARARGRELIDRLGLRDVAGLAPHQLSGGEQQRFALARALVGDPLLVLADEPIGNLDAESGALVLDLLRAVADDGRAVLMVTHQAEATARADRVLRLDRGRLSPAGGEIGPRLLDHADAGP
jgi:ABC-type lipoprotein export system ATPase subunit